MELRLWRDLDDDLLEVLPVFPLVAGLVLVLELVHPQSLVLVIKLLMRLSLIGGKLVI